MSKISAVFLSLALLLPACQQAQHKSAAETAVKEKVEAPLHLGAVHQVYPEQGFALLRIIGPMPKTGTTLITHPADGSNSRLGNLCIASQKPTRDRIIAADIRSGTVLQGDRVFLYRDIARQDDTEEEITVIDAPAEETPTPPTIIGEPLPGDAGATVADDTIPEPTAAGVETTVLPTTRPNAPGSAPDAPATPYKAPSYINDIPDNIDDWD